mgnify:CR=1 FL=1
MFPLVIILVTAGVTGLLNCTETLLEFAVVVVKHVAFEVKMQLITSILVKDELT